jgi:hypothetical protein
VKCVSYGIEQTAYVFVAMVGALMPAVGMEPAPNLFPWDGLAADIAETLLSGEPQPRTSYELNRLFPEAGYVGVSFRNSQEFLITGGNLLAAKEFADCNLSLHPLRQTASGMALKSKRVLHVAPPHAGW